MVLVFAATIEQPILAVAIGVACGGLLQFVFQIPFLIKNGYRLLPEYDFTHPGLKKMSILILPATMGMAVAQINIFVSTILASYLPEGSITYLYYSMRLIQFPIGIFGVAMGMAVLPTLSEHAAKREFEKLSNDFSFALRFLFFITVPAMVGLISLREPIVNILFQRGKFDYAATVGTAQALLFYSLGIWCIVGSRVITASFYSMQDTKTPVKIAAVALVTNIIFSLLLMHPLKHSGLALANSIASGVNFTLLFFFLNKKLKQIDVRKVFMSFSKTLFASSIMGITGGILLRGDIWQIQGSTLDKIFYLSGTMALCTCLYFIFSYIMKSEEAFHVMTMIRQRFRQ
jgi:putative peptidoglycan lipid II flippase